VRREIALGYYFITRGDKAMAKFQIPSDLKPEQYRELRKSIEELLRMKKAAIELPKDLSAEELEKLLPEVDERLKGKEPTVGLTMRVKAISDKVDEILGILHEARRTGKL
jgi:hypothetical protein